MLRDKRIPIFEFQFSVFNFEGLLKQLLERGLSD